MVIRSIAPTRISLLGGGTDVGNYRLKHGGMCLSLAINIYQELILSNEGLKQVLPEGATESFHKAFFKEYGLDLTVTQAFSGYINGGIGSSASAAVALLGGIYKFKGLKIDRQEIAEKAWDIEVNKLGMFGGKQDQYAASFGGMNVFEFPKDNAIPKINPLPRELSENLRQHLSLFYTGFNRQKANLQEKLMFPDPTQTEHLHRMKENLVNGVGMLIANDFKSFGDLMDENWESKKKTNRVSTEAIDDLYARGRRAGAWGGKLCGSGGGGYMLFVHPPEKRPKLITEMNLQYCDFEIDHNGLNTRII